MLAVSEHGELELVKMPESMEHPRNYRHQNQNPFQNKRLNPNQNPNLLSSSACEGKQAGGHHSPRISAQYGHQRTEV